MTDEVKAPTAPKAPPVRRGVVVILAIAVVVAALVTVGALAVVDATKTSLIDRAVGTWGCAPTDSSGGTVAGSAATPPGAANPDFTVVVSRKGTWSMAKSASPQDGPTNGTWALHGTKLTVVDTIAPRHTTVVTGVHSPPSDLAVQDVRASGASSPGPKIGVTASGDQVRLIIKEASGTIRSLTCTKSS